MTKVWAFDNRRGTINEEVTLGQRRTLAQAGLEAFRHPRIRVAPEVRALASQPAPATWGRLDHRGVRVPTYAELEALDDAYGHPADAYRAMAARDPAVSGGVYEALTEGRG